MQNLSRKVNDKVNLIWGIANKLQQVYKPHEYGDVILPLTVLKRFDSVLEKTKDAVLEMSKKFDKTVAKRDNILKLESGNQFYNTSLYNFKKLLDDPANIVENFNNYINGYSEEVQEIMKNFELDRHIERMAENNLLYSVIQEFSNVNSNLHPDEISNIEMGYIFEEIIRRFSEAHNEEAGQHYTPREVVDLMVNILFSNEEHLASTSKVINIYDGACGTGGILSASMEYLNKLNSSSRIYAYGQEINAQTYAICKADILIKGENANNIRKGNTLSEDKFENEKFDYILMNPPFGRRWKAFEDKVKTEAKLGKDGRFPAGTPAVNDSQLLFLQNAVSKMKDENSKVAIIHNGSALFKGDAGSGESEIRRSIIENDLLDCIIQLPNDIFYNTGIATYIWILDNNKDENRKGKVQLINANNEQFYAKMRKSLGDKRNEMLADHISKITQIYADFEESEHSKIFNNEYFGYTKLTILQPLLDENEEIVKDKKGKIKHDKNLTDTENVPLSEDIDEYLKREVLPFSPNAYIDEKKTKIGYEISFTKYFYKFVPPRSTEEIKKEILEINRQLENSLKELFDDE